MIKCLTANDVITDGGCGVRNLSAILRTTALEIVPFNHSSNPASVGHLRNQIYAAVSSGGHRTIVSDI